MDAKVIWLLVFVGLYWAYCVYWGIKGHLQAKTASDYFLAGRGISIWVLSWQLLLHHFLGGHLWDIQA